MWALVIPDSLSIFPVEASYSVGRKEVLLRVSLGSSKREGPEDRSFLFVNSRIHWHSMILCISPLISKHPLLGIKNLPRTGVVAQW